MYQVLLITRGDRIYLGQRTIIWQGDMFLIAPQNKPWTWMSTLFILVGIELVVATRCDLLALL